MISSFGGNSMELMWLFTNNLQLIYYISAINVNFPDIINEYFPYVQICNANNPYISRISYLIISDVNFKRGDVSNSIGPKSFYVSCSDKIPLLIPIFIIFIILKLTDFCDLKSDIKCINYVFKFITSLKYNFFLRICIELELEVAFNAIVNLYFNDFSSTYEIISITMAALFIGILLYVMTFSTYFGGLDKGFYGNTDLFERYSCLYCEIRTKDDAALFCIIIYFARRLYFCIGIIMFYQSKNVQIFVCITSSLFSSIYNFNSRPYKEIIFNVFCIINELAFLSLSCITYFFDEIKFDQNTSSSTTSQDIVGYVFLGLICFVVFINLIYLIPLKCWEIYKLIKRIIYYCKNGSKVISKDCSPIVRSGNKFIITGNTTSNSNTLDNNCTIEVVPKLYKMYQERNKKALQESNIYSFRNNLILNE